MMYINHRINSVAQLKEVPLENGIELDVRYHNDSLILTHDPFGHQRQTHETLEALLREWEHQGPLILNIKTEGIEMRCIDLMHQYNIKNWFFLDLSMPYFAIYAQKAFKSEIDFFSPDNLAVRFSEYEPIEYALSFSKKVKWVWVDCFSYLPLDANIYRQLKSSGFKVCLVSPELQKHSLGRISEFKNLIDGMEIDAVCTKRPDLWE